MRNRLTLALMIITLVIITFIAACAVPATPSPVQQSPQIEQKASQVAESGEISLDRNFELVVDDSGSMSEKSYAGSFSSRMEAAKWAVEEFVTKIVPAEANLGLYALNRGQLVDLGKENRDKISSEMKRLSASGNTPLNSSIRNAVNILVKQRESQLGYGEFYVIVVTDGQATDDKQGFPDTTAGVNYALERGIPIITIGFGIPQGHSLAKQSLSYRSAESPEQLLAALKETQAESDYFDISSFPNK